MNQSSQDNYQEAADDSIFFQELKLTGIQKNKRIGAGSQQSRRSQYALEDSFQTQELSRNYNTRSNSFIDRVNQISQRSKFQERSHSNQQSWRYARQDPNASRERERSREYSLSSQPYQHQRQQDLSFEHIDEIQQLIQELDQQDSQFSQQLVQNDIDQESKPEALLKDEIKYLNQYLSSIDVDNNEKEIEKLLLEYPYVCRECPKPFTDLLKFREHMTEKHFALALRLGIAKYLCKICNLKAFQQKRYYLSHLINCYCSKHKIELTPQQIQKIKIADQLRNSHKYDLQNNIKRLNVQ